MSAFSYKIIRKHLRDARKRLRLKQVDVAIASDVSLPFYGKLERGEICPSLERLIRICETLQLPLTEVFKGIMPLQGSLPNATSTEATFAEFFSHLGDRVDDKTNNPTCHIINVIKDCARQLFLYIAHHTFHGKEKLILLGSHFAMQHIQGKYPQ